MNNRHVLFITQTALIAAMYTALTYLQNFLLPGTTSSVIQFRISECLNVFALFSPAAIPGLVIGCILSNLYNIASGLPLDMIFGSVATLCAGTAIYVLRNVKIKSYPLLSMLMPAIFNGIIVGWEIEFFFVEGTFAFVSFIVEGALVALGELLVMLTLGSALYYIFVKRRLDVRLFNK